MLSPAVWMSASATPRALSAFRIAAIRALAERRARAEVGARRRTPAWKSAMSGTSVAVPLPSTAIVGVVSVVCAAAGAASSSVAASAANPVLMPLLRLRRESVTSRAARSSAVVVDHLDVVPVGIQDERPVVARVVDGALARTAVVLVARGERRGVERPHGRVVPRREREVDMLRERPPVADQREAEVLADQLDTVRLVHPDPQPGMRSDRRVEALRRRGIADTQPQVIDATVGHRVLALGVHRLHAVAVRVEQEPAVVVRAVDRARAGR